MAKLVWYYCRFLALFVVISLMVSFHFLMWGFHRTSRPMVWHLPNAHPERGPALVRKFGCSSCHTLPENSVAERSVGPNLANVKDQIYIAGSLQNTPENLMRWIQNPQLVRPRTAMPNLGIGPTDARDIVAYLYGQRNTGPSM